MSIINHRIGFVVLLAGLLLACVSCTDDRQEPLYSHFEVIDDALWNIDNEVFFSIPIDEPQHAYSIIGVLRVGPKSHLKSIPVGVVEEDANGMISTSVFNCPFSSELVNNSGFNLSEYSFTIDKARFFEEKGVHTISFRHLLKDSVASGIVEVGLIVRPVK